MNFQILLFLMLVSQLVPADILLKDEFDGGTFSNQHLIKWKGEGDFKSYSEGNDALSMIFNGNPDDTADSSSEQRIYIPVSREIWVSYDLYIPSNYHHRTTSDSSANNKFFALFNNNYKPGFQVNFSMIPDDKGGSLVDIRYYNSGREQGNRSHKPTTGWPTLIDVTDDLGKWHKIEMIFKVPTSSDSADGTMILMKNNDPLLEITTLQAFGGDGLNFFDEAYFFGWANSGHKEDTEFLIDNVVIRQSKPSLPKPPTLGVQ
jgi:hypothetical protein